MAKRRWYRLGPGCEWDGLTAGTTILGVREAQMKVLKQGFMLPSGELLAGAPPILPEEWFGFDDGATDIRDLYLNSRVIIPYDPSETELDFAYEHMYPGLKPKTAKRSSDKTVDESVADEQADKPIEDSEDNHGE